MEEIEPKTKRETLTSLTGIEKIDPFFKDIMKNENKLENKSDDFTGKGANLKLNKKWNIKIQFGVDFFNELFTFLSEIGNETILAFTKQSVKIYVVDPSGTHLSLVSIDKTEMSEYINTDINLINSIVDIQNNKETEVKTELETLVYIEFDILEEMSLNNKYPIDIYFDTKEQNTMYIVNGKSIESRSLKDTSNQDSTLETYKTHPNNLIKWLKNEESFIINVSYVSFSNTLKALEKKKSKKDKSASKNVKVIFGKNEIDFRIESETKSSTFKMSGDDIAIKGTRDVSFLLDLEILTKLARIKFKTNALLHINENLPLIMETKFGAGKIKLYYLMAQIVSEEQQTSSEEQSTPEE